MKKILLINGHPDKESYCFALANAYAAGVSKSNAKFKRIDICDLDFNVNLEYGYRKRTELEPDLLTSWDKIKWADHIVWVHPVWWASYPAIMKGFIDRLFLPGFAFQKRENSVWWDKFLTDKSARIISTLDQPTWYYRWINHRPSYYALKSQTCQFVGIKKVSATPIGPLRLSKEKFRKKWLAKIERLGEKNK